MPRYDDVTYGAPCWVEIIPSDLEAVKPFYKAVLNWDFTDTGADMGHYNIISVGDDVVGGCMQHSPEQMGPAANYVSLFFATENVEASLNAGVERGGSIGMPAMEVPGQGTFGVAADPHGVLYCLWKPGGRKGFDKWGEHGFASWFELHTPNAESEIAYYSAVLGDDIGTAEMGEDMVYYTLDVNGEQCAGVFDVSSEMSASDPGFWLVYFGVDDTDEAVAAVEAHGGSVLMPPMDSPHGRFATVQDPGGTMFNVVCIRPESA